MIDHIFYINLDEDVEKRSHMHNMLSTIGQPFDRFKAICPTLKAVEPGGQYRKFFSKSKVLEARSYFHNKSSTLNVELFHLRTLGCYLSHYKLLEHIYNNYRSFNNVLILEDDVRIFKSTIDMASDTLNLIKQDWDILRSMWFGPDYLEKINYCHPLSNFYNINMQKAIFRKIEKLHQTGPICNLVSNLFCGGTHFQVVNVNSIPKILHYLDSEIFLFIDANYTTNKLNIFNRKFNVMHNIFNQSSIAIRKHKS